MPQTATIKKEAFEVVKAMQTDGLDWGEGYRLAGLWRRSWPRMSIGGSAISTPPPRAIAATAPVAAIC